MILFIYLLLYNCAASGSHYRILPSDRTIGELQIQKNATRRGRGTTRSTEETAESHKYFRQDSNYSGQTPIYKSRESSLQAICSAYRK